MDFPNHLRHLIEGTLHELLDFVSIILTNDENLSEITKYRAPYAWIVGIEFQFKKCRFHLEWFGPTDCTQAIQTNSMIFMFESSFHCTPWIYVRAVMYHLLNGCWNTSRWKLAFSFVIEMTCITKADKYAGRWHLHREPVSDQTAAWFLTFKPRQAIRELANKALIAMNGLLADMYEADIKGARPSVAPEKL